MTREPGYWFAGFFVQHVCAFQIKYLNFIALTTFEELKVANVQKLTIHVMVVLTTC